MRRYLFVGLIGLGLFCGGIAAGYLYYEHRLVSVSYTTVYLDRNLTDAKSRFLVMKLIGENRTKDAYGMVETQMLGDVMIIDHWSKFEMTDRVCEEARALVRKVAEYYDTHPERRKAVVETIPALKNVFERAI
jgi:hypothetical protein